MQEEEGQQCPEPAPVQRYRTAVLDDRKWAENAEFNGDVRFVAPVTRVDQTSWLEPG